MAESDGQERTEQPSGKRLGEARAKGQIPRSREFNTAIMLLASSGALLILGEQMLKELMRLMTEGLTVDREEIFDVAAMWSHLTRALIDGVLLIAPLLALMVLAAVGSTIAVGGWNFTLDAISFKLDKLDPIKGFSRIFSVRGLIEMVKGLFKFALVGGAAILVLQSKYEEFIGLGTETLSQGLAHMGSLIGWSFLTISAAMILIAALDVPFQLWDHNRQLKMTKQEVKEEHKQMEGNPEVKSRQRRVQMQLAQRRMMEEVPKADVVITNPTHFAVALRYDQGKMDAPIVVAKGADLLASRIRSLAAEHKVPIVSAPPLARSLYHVAELNEPVPMGLYRAVAQVLAYVYQLRQGVLYNAEGVRTEMKDLPIPEDLRRD